MATAILVSVLALLPAVGAAIFGTCTPEVTRVPNFGTFIYPTTLTDILSCTQNFSMIAPPFFDRTWFSNHEQTLTTLQPFQSEPTIFPYTHVVTVQGVLSRTEWVNGGLIQTVVSTVTETETISLVNASRTNHPTALLSSSSNFKKVN